MADSRIKVEIVDLLRNPVNPDPDRAPNKEIKCKYLLVENRQLIYFIFGPVANYRYHAQLLDELCRRRNIPAGWVSQPDVVEVYDKPYRIRGGGLMDIDHSQRQISIHGHSSAYGRPPAGILNKALSSHSFFNDYRVSDGY